MTDPKRKARDKLTDEPVRFVDWFDGELKRQTTYTDDGAEQPKRSSHEADR